MPEMPRKTSRASEQSGVNMSNQDTHLKDARRNIGSLAIWACCEYDIVYNPDLLGGAEDTPKPGYTRNGEEVGMVIAPSAMTEDINQVTCIKCLAAYYAT